MLLVLQKVDCCEVCGVIAHESCVRKVPDDCRPVAEAGERMVHQWRPAGTVLQDKEVIQLQHLAFQPLLSERQLDGQSQVIEHPHLPLYKGMHETSLPRSSST